MSGAENNAFVPLPEAEVRRLLALTRQGDYQARERLCSANMRLVRSIARRFTYAGHDPEDLFQVGCIGLLKAIDKFDERYQVCFSTYAVPLIMGEIRRHLRDDTPLKISRQLKERAALVERQRRLLYQQEGQEPLLRNLAEATGLSQEQVVAALEATQPPLSLQEPRYGPSGDAISLEDTLPDQSLDIGDLLVDKLTLLALVEELPERLAYVLRCRYFADRTQADLAQEMGVSQVQISRLEKKALSLIRERLTPAS